MNPLPLRLAALVGLLASPSLLPAQRNPHPPSYPADLDASRLAQLVDGHLGSARAELQRMLAVTGPRTAGNTLRPWDEASGHASLADGLTKIAINVHPDSAVRAEGLRLEERVDRFRREMEGDPRFALAFQALDTLGLTPEERLLVARTRRDFHRAGADKDEATRNQLSSHFQAMDRLSTRFARNIAEDTATVRVKLEELAGMPADWIAKHQRDAEGRVILTTSYPDFFPVINFAANRSLRKRMVFAFAGRAWPVNAGVLDSLRRVREAAAKLLGYRDWASYQAEIQMLGSTDSIRGFLARVDQVSRPARERLIDRYLARLKKEDSTIVALGVGDANYAAELIRREEYAVDGREVRAYFPFDRVKTGLLDFAQELFGLTFRQVTIPVWHPSVEAYEAREKGRLIGRFYLDLHPRPQKYQHAAMMSLQPGIRGGQLPEALLVTNIPGGVPGDPGLMEPRDVRLFFHEFGHLLHVLFAVRPYFSTNWPDEHDFIEAPSQMLEEWIVQPDVLRRFARHHQTAVPIPVDLVRRMDAADAFRRPMQAGMETAFSVISLQLHDRPAGEGDPDSVSAQALASYMGVQVPAELHFPTSFDHLGMNSYSATYYTYLWSQVISKDLWSAFNPARPLDPAPARRYRDIILRPGGSKPAAELVREFLGRPFGFDSWQRWLEGESVAGT